MAPPSIRVVIADDHPAVLFGIERELATASTLAMVGSAHDSSELIEILDTHACAVLITDYAMPGGVYGDGATLLSFVKRRYPRLQIIVFTMIENPGIIRDLLANDICRIVSKADAPYHLVQAVYAAVSGGRYLSPTIGAALASARLQKTRSLTERESEVVRLYVSGLTVNEIAEQLKRSKKTVSTHKMSGMKKLGIERDSDLYLHAILSGLITLGQTGAPQLSGAAPTITDVE